ncbi:MAG TPA: cupin domain-containing protein [Lunatimonas sp.]|nr:cupin domain-containing protein [Lunatimonas sp.]
MAKTNQIIESKTYGDKAKFLVTAADSKGELLRAQVWIKPGADGPPEHYHPVQSETFEVIKGQLNLNYEGKEIVLLPGEKITVPPNTLHKWYNAGACDLEAIVELRPALKTEFFLESMYSLDYQGKLDKKGLPNPLQFAAILNECYGELFVIGPPIFLQKFMAKVVGGLARMFGIKGYVPFPIISIVNK